MMYQAVQKLPSGALDIIGDVHGEYAALHQLLRHLGYDGEGRHPEKRTLVFVGDLCDRGPDSPAVLRWVQRACEAGYARMVLGNHELNALVGLPKDGSGWLFAQRAQKDGKLYAPWQRIPAAESAELLDFLLSKPVILERDDIRIVHAAWLDEAVEALAQDTQTGLVERYRQCDEAVLAGLAGTTEYAEYLREQECYGEAAENPEQVPPPLPATAYYDLQQSLRHPFRALTSGPERMIAQPFYAGGRWRFTGRAAWWNDYADDIPVVVGHYWRNWYPKPANQTRENLFREAGVCWLGPKKNVFCIDFSVGARWRDRKARPPVSPEHSVFRLAALRWPERTLVFDDGTQEQTQG